MSRPLLIECLYGPTGQEDILEITYNDMSRRYVLSGNQPERFIGSFATADEALEWVKHVGLYHCITVNGETP